MSDEHTLRDRNNKQECSNALALNTFLQTKQQYTSIYLLYKYQMYMCVRACAHTHTQSPLKGPRESDTIIAINTKDPGVRETWKKAWNIL